MTTESGVVAKITPGNLYFYSHVIICYKYVANVLDNFMYNCSNLNLKYLRKPFKIFRSVKYLNTYCVFVVLL